MPRYTPTPFRFGYFRSKYGTFNRKIKTTNAASKIVSHGITVTTSFPVCRNSEPIACQNAATDRNKPSSSSKHQPSTISQPVTQSDRISMPRWEQQWRRYKVTAMSMATHAPYCKVISSKTEIFDRISRMPNKNSTYPRYKQPFCFRTCHITNRAASNNTHPSNAGKMDNGSSHRNAKILQIHAIRFRRADSSCLRS